MSRRLQSECGAPTTYLIARWQTMVFHRIEAKRNFSCIWWGLAPWQIDGWCERGQVSLPGRVVTAARHLGSHPGGKRHELPRPVVVREQGIVEAQALLSSSVVWSTRHFLALRPSARRRHSIKLSRRW